MVTKGTEGLTGEFIVKCLYRRALHARSFRRTHQVTTGCRIRFRWPPAWLSVLAFLPAVNGHAQSVEDLQRLSIEDLGKVEITSVSKQPQQLKTAASSIYVISHDEIIRSGATSIPEILRLAPNLFVSQSSPSAYIITARGFSGNIADQNFTNKLLVLIDGRSVYTPLYAGVYWDTVDVLPEDIERIEVISGPGATLWGANAVNGVINIITRKAGDTQGGVAEVGVGNQESLAALQYGGKVGDDLAYRIYGKVFYDRADDTSPGSGARDSWYKPQGGFRVDWSPGTDLLTVQGDVYAGGEQQLQAPDTQIEGHNLQATWQHDLGDGSSLQILAYYDQSQRDVENEGTGFSLDTYNLEVQHNFSLGSWNNIVWGAGERINSYSIQARLGGTTSLLFVPSSLTLNLADAFAEDRVTLTDRLDLTVGLKLENDPWSGLSPLPMARLSWNATNDILLWAHVGRAIRAPTPFDTDVVEKEGTSTILTGNPNFLPEELTAYEIGSRAELSEQASISVTGYLDQYDHLKTLNYGTQYPLEWGNQMAGNVYGVEAWGNYQVLDWWRLSAGVNFQREALHLQPGAIGFLGVAQAGDDPHHQASLRSSMNLADDLTFDTDFRYVGVLPDPVLPQYVELNTRLAWKLSKSVEISLSGFNLLHPQHQEFPGADEIKRSFLLDTRWNF